MKDPKSKKEFLNRILSYDFTGDIRTLGNNVQIMRSKDNTVRLFFPETSRMFELTVRMPRPASPAKTKRTTKTETEPIKEAAEVHQISRRGTKAASGKRR